MCPDTQKLAQYKLKLDFDTLQDMITKLGSNTNQF